MRKPVVMDVADNGQITEAQAPTRGGGGQPQRPLERGLVLSPGEGAVRMGLSSPRHLVNDATR